MCACMCAECLCAAFACDRRRLVVFVLSYVFLFIALSNCNFSWQSVEVSSEEDRNEAALPLSDAFTFTRVLWLDAFSFAQMSSPSDDDSSDAAALPSPLFAIGKDDSRRQ